MASKSNSPQAAVQGQALSPLDHFWLDTIRNAAKESVGALQEAAKQLIAIAAFAQTIYFGAISFSDVKAALDTLPTGVHLALVLLLVIPVAFWIACLWFAILVFKPEIYRTNLNSPTVARDDYSAIAAYKHRQLQRAYIALVVGFIPLLINVVLYLVYFPVPPKGS